MSPIEQYWDVKPKKVLYGGDRYYREQTFDMKEFLEVAFTTGFLATGIIFLIGIWVML